MSRETISAYTSRAFQRLVNWATDRGVDVFRGQVSEYDPVQRIAVVRWGAPRPVHDLAHELGHDLTWRAFYHRWPHNIVRREQRAWDAGQMILRRIRIRVDPWQWEQDVARAMRWHFWNASISRNPTKGTTR